MSAPEQPAEIFGLFVDDCKAIFADAVRSIILFGSGARGEYVRKKSDINFLVVLDAESIDRLAKVIPYIPKWRKHAISVPLFLGPEYIENSLDSFPLEFLDMKHHHQLVYGEDLLADIEIKSSDLRLQCEREVKGKLLHLRQNFISSGMHPKTMTRILTASLPAIEVILQGLMYLKQQPIPAQGRDILRKGSELFGMEVASFDNILAMKTGERRFPKEQLAAIFEDTIANVRKLSLAIDRL